MIGGGLWNVIHGSSGQARGKLRGGWMKTKMGVEEY